ncbi:hypothetical protein SESBI_22363 [Sesbania bispinosa]|nr:hypothetical protein SESBI_22363 [Sesbania bispinosa]
MLHCFPHSFLYLLHFLFPLLLRVVLSSAAFQCDMADCGSDSERESGSGGSATTSLQIPGSMDSFLHVDYGMISSDVAEPTVETIVSRRKWKVSGSASEKRRLKPEELRVIQLGDDPVKLKDFMDQMAPQLDRKALALEMKRQCLASAEKDKAGVGSSTVVPVASNVVVTEVVVPSNSATAPRKRSRTEKTPVSATGQASTDKGVCPEGGLVDVFQTFTGIGADIRSLWDNRFDVVSVIDSHLTLRSDVKRLDKRGDRSAHVMLQVYGAQMAFLGRYLKLKAKNEQAQHSDLGQKVVDLETQLAGYEEMKMKVVGLEGKVALLSQENVKLKEDKKIVEKSLKDMTVERDSLKVGINEEKLKVKTVEEKYETDFQQLNFEVAKSYGLCFEQDFIQVKHFNPTADVSNCDSLKELINNKLVDLGDGEEENGSADGLNNEEVVDSQGLEANKSAEEVNEVRNEEQGNGPVFTKEAFYLLSKVLQNGSVKTFLGTDLHASLVIPMS